jgi:tetratricopeptide (TPR) repeat protein
MSLSTGGPFGDAGRVPAVSRKAKSHADAARRHRDCEEFVAARAELERALAVIDRGPPLWASPMRRLRWARAHADLRCALGELGIEEGRPDLARIDFEQAALEYESLSHEDSADMASVLNNLGVVYEKLGYLDASESCLGRALDIDRRTNRPARSIAVSLNNIAYAYQAAGYQTGAVRAIEEAMRLAGLDPEAHGQLEQERAVHLMAGGRHAEALVATSQRLASLDPDSVAAASCLGNLGQVYAELQRWAEAEPLQRQAVAIRRRRQPGSLPLAIALANLAATLVVRGAHAEAYECLRSAVSIAERVAPRSLPLATMRGNLAGRLVDTDPASALRQAQQAIAGAPSGNRHLVPAYLAAAFAYDRLDNPAAAERALLEARAACLRISTLLPELRPVLTSLGALALRQGDLDAAAAHFDGAIAIAENQRAGAALEPGLELLFGTAKGAYHGRIVVAHERQAEGDAEWGFRAAEAFRARTLAELLATVGASRVTDPAEAEVAAELTAVRAQLGTVYRRIEGAAAEVATALRDRLEAKAEELRLKLRAMASQVTGGQRPVPCTLPEIQSRLGPDTLMALYEVTDDGTFLWGVHRDGCQFTRLEPDSGMLADTVEELLSACQGNGPPPAAALERLGEWLLRPLSTVLPGAGEFVVCAGGVLAQLPFEALPLDGVILADRCTTWSLPSATTAVRYGDRPRDREPVRTFAGFGVSQTAGMAPLPGAAREVREAAGFFPGQALTLLDSAVTVAAVRTAASGSRYVHFATHGVIYDDRPLYSGLPLAPRGTEYEFLAAHEMFSLQLCADVVTCSGCETAVGATRTGEGVVGLSYALFAAGARSVVLSRWPVRDAIARRIMTAFYQELAAGAPPAEALRSAAAWTREHHNHPREWASFMLLDLTVRSRRCPDRPW